ncbi:BspA family leucine-rich repeat surface protein [Leuconostoc pseudomesenteroides]|uniref:BspA family leucine-rich repeat surface protein n=1 Tax=Leuconostoc pseudomesenteroides TaxID=33968 RepID=UPI00228621C5|nr:BspA family leucine-rich repeat surface protein [Leuconostoc pseudomesenteroides]WAM38506.1 BspA family leucine-rich repeat surface protein [Leuconostoc pseudomesenteroides]
MKKYVRKAILLTITLLLVGASPAQMVAAVAAEQSNLKSATHDKTKTAALLDKVFKMPKRQSEVSTSVDNDKAEVQPEPKNDPVPEPDKPVVAQKEKISEPTPTLAPQLKATETITGTYGTSPYTLDPDTGVLEFGAGTLAEGAINNSTEFASYVSMIKEIKFSSGAKLPAQASFMFQDLSSLEKFDSANLDTSDVTSMICMFEDSAATTLDLSHFNTSAVTNMSYMFYGSEVATLDLSHFDTSAVVNMSCMFADSKALALDLSDFDTSAVTNMSYMFSNSAVTTLGLSSFNTSAVTNMSSMFASSKATTLDLSHFDTSAVTNMSSMFNNSKTPMLDLSHFDTSKVTDMYYMFYNSAATTINLSNFNTSNVTDMSGMFYSSAATTLDLSHFDTSHVIVMKYMFSGSKATTLNLNSFNTSAVTDMSYMFYYSAATTIDVSSFNTSAVTNMSYMFYQTYVQTLDLSHFTFSSECNVDQMLFTFRGDLWRLILGANQTFSANANFQNPTLGSTIPGAGSNYVSGKRWQIVGDGTDHAPTGAKISSADIPSDSRAVTTTYVWEHVEKWRGVNGNSPWYLNPDDGVLTFYQSEDGSPTALAEPVYDNLNNAFGWSVNIAQSVTAIRFDADIAAPVNSRNLFAGLENLTSFDSTNLDTSNVENMSYMFQGLYSLSTLNIGGFNTDKVTDMSFMFSELALNSLDLSHFNTDRVENMAGMFLMTNNLTTLDLSNFDTSNVKNMFAMFALNGVRHLNLSHFNTAHVENMQAMFLASFVETLDISSFNLSGLKNRPDAGLGADSPVMFMFSAMSALDHESEQTSNLWQVKLGEQTVFPDDPGFEAAPAAGTTIPGTNYVTNDAAWQIVGNGTVLNPKGDKVSTTAMWENAVRPVTYVWANQNQASPSIVSVDSINFGTLAANDFFNGNSPLATNMATGSVALEGLDSSRTYHVTVAQTSDWTTDGESDMIAKSDLKIKYGANDLSTNASSFWSGTSATGTKNIAFNHDTTKNFSIWLNPNAALSTNLLGKQLESELTWTLSDTPE